MLKVSRVFVEYSVPDEAKNNLSFQVNTGDFPKVSFFQNEGERSLSFAEVGLMVEAIRLCVPDFYTR